MIPSRKKIRSEIKKLRKYIDDSKGKTLQNIVEMRIAYAVETALRWSIEDTDGWGGRLEDVLENANILMKDLRERNK
jgi:hypothetical protein